MMTSRDAAFNAAMGQFQQELVRWNRQINLISRQDTLGRAAALIGQCRDAWLKLAEVELAGWPESGPVSYYDLGSGGGLPGFVWHELLGARFSQLRTVLVEPREKRAWFLERLGRLTTRNGFTVWNERWGEDQSGGGGEPGHILISLKALRLTDSAVLAGLAGVTGGRSGAVATSGGDAGRVIIARFYPPGQRWTDALAAELAVLVEPVTFGDLVYASAGHSILPPSAGRLQGAALVLSRYEVTRP